MRKLFIHFFWVFWISFLCVSSYPGANMHFFRNMVYCILSFCDIDIKIMQIRRIKIRNPRFSNSLDCRNTSWISNEGLNRIVSTRSQIFRSGKFQFIYLHQNPEYQKSIQNAHYNDFYQNSNNNFSTTISLICSIKMAKDNLTFVEYDSIETSKFVFVPSSKIPTVIGKCKRGLKVLIGFDKQTHLSQ